jgi:subtilisin family serine protease
LKSKQSSFNFLDNNNNTNPVAGDGHGTRCAGEIAAAANNSICGVGVAYGAKVSAIKLISNAASSSGEGLLEASSSKSTATDLVESSALSFMNQVNWIYSNSWGPEDDGKTIDGPHKLLQESIKKSIRFGRGGLGSIFVFASGNGGELGDDCNYDGYANSIYTVTIGAIDEDGKMPAYGEHCAAHLAVAYTGTRTSRKIVSRNLKKSQDKCMARAKLKLFLIRLPQI